MSKDLADEHFLLLKSKNGNDAIFISTDVKYVEVAYFVYGMEAGLQVSKSREHLRLDNFSPSPERLVG
nr:hypothetical protein [uncultured Duganella sp.]